MRIAIVAAALSVLAVSSAFADEYVHGYTRSNGTYVQPYYRSSPDSSYNDNYSVSPNVNLYTGVQGTRKPAYNDEPPQRDTFGSAPYGSGPTYPSSSYTSPFGKCTFGAASC